jgi:2-polyprenyl-3-methyl-5-hydroxy-6-metoxy-1,4-benzoquinol methylase
MKYRNRIYGNYVAAISDIKKISNHEELESRGPTMRNLIKNFFPKDKNSKILEIGCGHGALIYFAKKMGYLNVEGIDGSAQQVKLAKLLEINSVREGDLVSELRTVENNSFDAVVAFDVIEHFTKDELVDLIDEVRRVLKPNGSWIIHAPNAKSPFVGAIQYGDYTHEQAFTETSLTQVLKSSGFQDINFFECKPLVYGAKSFVRSIIWKIVRMLLSLMNAAETGSLDHKGIWTRNLYAIAIKKSI